jgi:hypothetical protein
VWGELPPPPTHGHKISVLEPSWNVMAQGDAREGKWRGNWRMEWVASTLHTTSELGVSNITTADAHTSAASSRLNWRPFRFKWTRPFRRKTIWSLRVCHHISNADYQRTGGRWTSTAVDDIDIIKNRFHCCKFFVGMSLLSWTADLNGSVLSLSI